VPFTVSHAAAVLPLQRLTRHRVPLAAMMIGSMAPDFQFFVPFDVSRDFTHDFAGLFAFCWPLGLAVWLLFVKVLERPTIELLPSPWRERVPRSGPVTPRALLLASLGIILGAMTHVAWDAFTHWGTPVSQYFPGLGAEVFEVRGRAVHVFSLLQYLSSVAGLLALAYWGYNLRHAPPPRRAARHASGFLTDRTRIFAALVVVGSSGLVALISFVETAGSRIEDRVFHLLINGMVAWALAWCVVAVMINRLAPARRPSR
jgi:membrane-bound metal-dependent hydrolase YbcI (DUF457 family)